MVTKKKTFIPKSEIEKAAASAQKEGKLTKIKGFRRMLCESKYNTCATHCKQTYEDMNRCYKGIIKEIDNPFVSDGAKIMLAQIDRADK